MKLELFIAGRYLFAKKSHNVINVISAISVTGIAIGTAALIIILSVYNGFDGIVRNSMNAVQPDIMILPSVGKSFSPQGEGFDWIRKNPAVSSVQEVVRENVFLTYAGRESTAIVKGVDDDYAIESGLDSHIVEGGFRLHFGEQRECVLGSGLAYSLGAHPRFSDPMVLYFPDRTSRISLANPLASLKIEDVFPSAVFSVSADVDDQLLYVPIDLMRSLMSYDDEVSELEIRLANGEDEKMLVKEISQRLGPDYKVLDRVHQNPAIYKVLRYEKAAIFVILLFVVLIVAFNIFGSLSMLIIEKRQDIGTLSAMGASQKSIRSIFRIEGWLISLLGLLIGLVFGISFALLQQKFGIIKMPGNYIVDAYPVILKYTDVLLTVGGVAVIGYLIALIPQVRQNQDRQQDL